MTTFLIIVMVLSWTAMPVSFLYLYLADQEFQAWLRSELRAMKRPF